MRTKEPKAKKPFMSGYKTYDTAEGYGNGRQWRSSFYERMDGKEAERIIEQEEGTPYQILGISVSASQVEIKAAFRTLIMKWHPDKNRDNITEAEAMSKKIIAAYTVLTK